MKIWTYLVAILAILMIAPATIVNAEECQSGLMPFELSEVGVWPSHAYTQWHRTEGMTIGQFIEAITFPDGRPLEDDRGLAVGTILCVPSSPGFGAFAQMSGFDIKKRDTSSSLSAAQEEASLRVVELEKELERVREEKVADPQVEVLNGTLSRLLKENKILREATPDAEMSATIHRLTKERDKYRSQLEKSEKNAGSPIPLRVLMLSILFLLVTIVLGVLREVNWRKISKKNQAHIADLRKINELSRDAQWSAIAQEFLAKHAVRLDLPKGVTHEDGRPFMFLPIAKMPPMEKDLYVDVPGNRPTKFKNIGENIQSTEIRFDGLRNALGLHLSSNGSKPEEVKVESNGVV